MRHTHTSRVSSVSVHTHLNINIRNHVDLYIFFIILYQVQVTSIRYFQPEFYAAVFIYFVLSCPTGTVRFANCIVIFIIYKLADKAVKILN